MAGKVFFSVSMSLDGFIAPESMEGFIAPEERRDDPDVQRWMAQWMELQQWIFPQRFFRENLKLGEGGEEGRDNEIVRETFERTGASVMGKRMFDLGEIQRSKTPQRPCPSASAPPFAAARSMAYWSRSGMPALSGGLVVSGLSSLHDDYTPSIFQRWRARK